MPFEIEEDAEPERGARGAAPPPRSFLGRAGRVAAKLLFATGRAAWVTGTSLLVLVVPLIIEMDREQQLTEMESQQMGVLAGPAGGGGMPAGGGAPGGGAPALPAK
jgi:import receptor subunit TOM22